MLEVYRGITLGRGEKYLKEGGFEGGVREARGKRDTVEPELQDSQILLPSLTDLV